MTQNEAILLVGLCGVTGAAVAFLREALNALKAHEKACRERDECLAIMRRWVEEDRIRHADLCRLLSPPEPAQDDEFTRKRQAIQARRRL